MNKSLKPLKVIIVNLKMLSSTFVFNFTIGETK
jgi:hypothetical protein